METYLYLCCMHPVYDEKPSQILNKKYRCYFQTSLTTLIMNRSFCSNVYILKMNMSPVILLLDNSKLQSLNNAIIILLQADSASHFYDGSVAPPFWLDAQNMCILLLLLLNVHSWYVDWPHWSFPKDSSTGYVSRAHGQRIMPSYITTGLTD